MKELITKVNTSNNKKWFAEKEKGRAVECAYRDRSCSPDCAACHIDTDNGMINKFRCIRGDFDIGSMNK